MPGFDPSRLTEPEWVAWRDRLKRDGPKEIARLFDGAVRAVSALRDEGKNPTEIATLIVSDHYDAEYLTLIGPIFRHEAMVLLEAMVRQALGRHRQEQPHVRQSVPQTDSP